jgi:hypothetical protein
VLLRSNCEDPLQPHLLALPDFVEPMKAKLVASMSAANWIHEIKFEEYSALALRGGSQTRVLSRNKKDLRKNSSNLPWMVSPWAALQKHRKREQNRRQPRGRI